MATLSAPQIGPSSQQALNSQSVPNGGLSTTPVTPTAVALPKPLQTSTGQTGVATSDLADQTIATQQSGYNNLQGAVAAHAATKAATPTFNPQESVVDLLASKGQPSDFASRAKLAEQAGIQNYVGSEQQNQQLMGFVNNPPKPVAGTEGTTPTATQPAPTTTQPAQTGLPTTGSPGDVYNQPILDVQTQLGEALDQRNAQVAQIMNGTFPLTASQQASISATQQQFAEVARLQMIANKSYEGGVALAGNREGLNIQNPSEYFAEQEQAVNDGLNKINSLDAEGAKTLADLTQSFMDKDYTMINDNYNALQKTLEDKQSAIQDLQKRTDDLYTSARDYNEKIREFNIQQQNDLRNFNAQYGGLLNHTTGLLDVPSGQTAAQYLGQLGLGGSQVTGVGSVIDTGSASFKALPSGVQRVLLASKGNSIAIDSSTDQGKQFMQNANTIGTLQTLDPNETVVEASKATGLAGLFSSLTGIGSGASASKLVPGANLPNIQNLTVGQAIFSLQKQMANAAGVPVQAIVYNDNPQKSQSDLVTLSKQNPQVSTFVSANPNLTPEQVLQAFNYVPESAQGPGVGTSLLEKGENLARNLAVF